MLGAGVTGPLGTPTEKPDDGELGADELAAGGKNGAGAENTRPPETVGARSSNSPASAAASVGRGR